jgi:HEAT repeat protein
MPYVEFLLKGANVTDLTQRDYLDGLSAAAKALGQSQLPEALLALTALARSVIKRLRRIAIEAVMLFDPQDRAEALYSLIDTYDPDVLKNVALGLNEAGDPRAALALIRAANECKGRASVKARAALVRRPEIRDLDFLVKCLSERWATVRRYAAERLKMLKDRRAVPALLKASRDDDVEVQLAVFEALSPFAAEDEAVTQRMLEAIGYGDISVRQAACESLGEARCRAAVPDLIRAIHNFFLRPRATEALRRIGDRKGYLALKRLERREKLFRKKPVELRGVKAKKMEI